MIPEALVLLQEQFYEDDIIFLTTKAAHIAEHFSIDFSIMLQNDEGSTSQDWNIAISGYQKCHFTFEPAYELKLAYEHPLLWEFTNAQAELYYSGKIIDSPALLYDLYCAHRSLFNSNVPFPFAEKTDKLFQFSSGLFTTGPKQLLEHYGAILQKHGLDYSIRIDPASVSNPSLFGSNELSVLLLGDSFLVGEQFKFKRLD